MINLDKINKLLADEAAGNYLVKVTKVGPKRENPYYSAEYFVDVQIQVQDMNNPKRKFGVIVPGMGPKPIALNEDRKLHPYTYYWHADFEEALIRNAKNTQNEINWEGYYPKDRETGKIVVKD